MPLITHLLFAGFAPHLPIGTDGSILAQVSSVDQFSFAISGPPRNGELASLPIEPTQELIRSKLRVGNIAKDQSLGSSCGALD